MKNENQKKTVFLIFEKGWTHLFSSVIWRNWVIVTGFVLLLSSIRNSCAADENSLPFLFIEFFHLKSKLWAAEKKVQSMSFLLLWEFCRIKNFFFSPAPLHSAVFKQNFFRQMVLEGFCHMQNSVMTWNSLCCFPDFM